MTPHLYPIHISAHEKVLIIQPRGEDTHTWVFAPGTYQPSPWLRLDSLFQTKPHDLDEFIREHPPMNQPAMTRFLKMLYTHFGLDTRAINGIMDTDNPIGVAFYRANLVAYRYCFHPIERFTALSRVTHPAWSTVNVYRNSATGTDRYFRHRSAYQLGHSLIENWGGMKVASIAGTQELVSSLPSIGELVLTRSGHQRQASIRYNQNISPIQTNGFKRQLDLRTQAMAQGPNGLQKLFNEGLDRFKQLLKDPTVGPAISYYLYSLKGDLQCVETDGRITIGLEVLLFLVTGQLGKSPLGTMTHSIPNKGASSAEHVGPFTLNTMHTLHALASSLYKSDMELRQEEALLLKPQSIVPMPVQAYKDLIVRIEIPEAEAKEQQIRFELTGKSGYQVEKTLKDDLIPGDEYIDLRYEDLPVDDVFTLISKTKDGKKRQYFKDISYRNLAGDESEETEI